ncbi:c-type cytochrome [Puniceibacterium sp. IMCC21224]|uniref:c-type cytochrome n=1 Tax=Puniceibacterium sp. IMCC21224 TaxID=1618204 RepID=UPI00064E067C|nr:c-type cytochrome [Puniceibacterium sp. IMCC21224]KMK66310.1 cytochrome c553 [Puniceibacterium sp. IMCC21224]
MPGRSLWVAFALSLATVDPGGADMLSDETPAYERCALCHGLFGDSPRDKFPRLAGQRPAYIASQIRAFLDGQRRNDGGQMVAVVTELGPDDIALVVDWFSSQAQPDPILSDDTTAEAMETGYIAYLSAGCEECHDERGSGAINIPYLASQHPAYLAKQMRDMRDGRRFGVSIDVMRAQLSSLSDADLDAIAAYLAAQDRTE